MAHDDLRAAASSFAQALQQHLHEASLRLRRRRRRRILPHLPLQLPPALHLPALIPPLRGMSPPRLPSSFSSLFSAHGEGASSDPPPMEDARDFVGSQRAPPPSGHSQREEQRGLRHQGQQHAPRLDRERHHAPDSSDPPPPRPLLDIEDVRAFIRSKLPPPPSGHSQQYGAHQVHQGRQNVPHQVHQGRQNVPHLYSEQQHHGPDQGPHPYGELQHHGPDQGPHPYGEQHHGLHHQGQNAPDPYGEQQHHGPDQGPHPYGEQHRSIHQGQHVPHPYGEQHRSIHQGQHVPHPYGEQHRSIHQGQHVPHLYSEQHHGPHQAPHPYGEQHRSIHHGQHVPHPYGEQHRSIHQGQHVPHLYSEQQQHHGLHHQGQHVPHIRSVQHRHGLHHQGQHAPHTEKPEHEGHGHLGLHYDQDGNRLQQHDPWQGHDENPRAADAQSHFRHVSSGLFGIGTMGTSPSSEDGGYIPLSSSQIHEQEQEQQQQQQQQLNVPSSSASSPPSPAFTNITGTNRNAHHSHGLLDIEDVRDFVESFLHHSFIRRQPSTSWKNKMPWHVPRAPFLARGLHWPPETFTSESERKEFYRRSRKRKPFLMGSPPLWTITAFNLLFLQCLMLNPVRKFSDFLRSLP